MSEAPKRIWMAPFEDKEIPNLWHEETQYIRADIVNELVEALENCLQFNGYYFDEEPIKALVAKVRKNND